MPFEKQRDYEVGYGKPPRSTRFKKGQSGNPRGRPSGSKNLSTLLSEALNEPVIVTENGRRRKISKRQAIIKQLVNQSAKGDGALPNSCSTSCRTSNAAPNRKPLRTGSVGQTSRFSSSSGRAFH